MPAIGSFGLLAVTTGVGYWYWLGAKTYEEILFYYIIMVNQHGVKNDPIVSFDEKIIYTNYIMNNSKRPIPVSRKWCRDENCVKHPIPAPRRKHLLGGKISIPAPGTKIGEKRRALNGYTKSYEIGIESNFSAL